MVIKELDATDGNVMAEVRREGNIMSRLDHELVISLYDQVVIGDRVFLVMEYARGGDLLEKIMAAPSGKLGVEEAQRIFAQLVLATEYMHERGVVHRYVAELFHSPSPLDFAPHQSVVSYEAAET